ncbi:MAG: DUF2341 domain-containing protein [Candidatus Moraniibacteriota bacterium]
MDIVRKKNKVTSHHSSVTRPSVKRKFFNPSVATDRLKKLYSPSSPVPGRPACRQAGGRGEGKLSIPPSLWERAGERVRNFSLSVLRTSPPKGERESNPPRLYSGEGLGEREKSTPSKIKNIFNTKKRKLIFSLALILLIIAPLSFYFWKKQAGASWWNSDWNYRRAITINAAQIPGDLNNFPMLVSFTDTNLTNKAQTDGDDIIFIESNGNRLNHEIEKYDSTTGELVAWVNIPQLDGDNDSIIYMYYGNQTVDNQQRPEDVWDENFIAVHHFNESSTALSSDSTRNNKNGTKSGFEGDELTSGGKVGPAYNLDGSNDYIYIPEMRASDYDEITMSVWFKSDVDNHDEEMLIWGQGHPGSGTNWAAMFHRADTNQYVWYVPNTGWADTEPENLNWNYSTMKLSSNNQWEFGFNGNSIGTYNDIANHQHRDISNYVVAGNGAWGYLDGLIDEVRISKTPRSNNWITTEYNNQNSPSTFISLGQEERGNSPALYLPFDEGFGTTAHDESSNRNDGNIVGATWKDESMCKSGKCLEFDGTGDYVEIADNKSLDLSEEVTLEAWVKPTSTTATNQTIISKVETPSEPTKIYRSVGPSATTAITVGTSNAMNITGDRATFATALPDNVGVGDAIQYDANDDGTVDALAFITGRISNTQYSISNVSGTVPAPVNADKDWGLFRAYTSLANAEKGVENTGINSTLRNFDDWTAGGDATADDVGKDLVASNQQWNIACYANGTMGDGSNFDFNGWTTGSWTYLRVYTPVNANEVGISQRHKGRWDNSYYYISATSYRLLYNYLNHIRIEGLQLFLTTISNIQYPPIIRSFINSSDSAMYVSDNILRADYSILSAGYYGYGFRNESGNLGNYYIYNNIFYNVISPSGGNSTAIMTLSGNNRVYNNTIFDCGVGMEGFSTLVKNNIIQNCTTDFIGTFNSSSANNLTSKTPGASNAFGTTYTTGTTTSTTASKLINSGETFITKKVQVGSIIKNTTDNTYTYVTALDSETQLSVANDIFVSGEAYTIYTNKYGNVSFVSTTAGSEDFHLSPTDTVARNSGADLSSDNIFPFNSDIDGQSRLGSSPDTSYQIPATSWDIGADEAQATQIYRSVAPGKTDALETGDGNSLTINGFTATFQRALADNVGVGDVIQYDDDGDGDIDSSDSLAFVTGRISNFQYTISNASGGTPVPVNNDNDWSLFRAYTSLANAENGDENIGIDSDLRNFDTWSGGKDLVVSKEQWNIACYANGTTADTTAVEVNGWTTGVQNFVKIYTSVNSNEVGVSQRHDGKWNADKYSLTTTNQFALYDDYIRVDGLQIRTASVTAGGTNVVAVGYLSSGNDIQISNSIIRGDNNPAYWQWAINIGDLDANVKMYNIIVYDVETTNSVVIRVSEANKVYIYNSTLVGGAIGLRNVSGITYAKNVLVKGSANNDFLETSGTLNCNYCASEDGTADDQDGDGISGNNKINQTFNFINEAGGDYHLSPTDIVARNAGGNLSNDPYLPITTDIDGDNRLRQDSGVAQWDIGPDESKATKIYRSVGPGNTSPLATDEAHENTVSVTSGIATFEAILPDRIGVGDAVLIDTNNDNSITSADTLLFVHGRTNSNTYTLRTHTGAIPSDISSNDTYQIFRAYTSLSNAEAGTKNTSIPITFNGGNRDLVTNNEEWNIACYGDGVDTSIVNIDDWTTGKENYIRVYTPTDVNEVGINQRHEGFWNRNKYILAVSATANSTRVVSVQDQYVIVDGLQLELTNNGYTSCLGIYSNWISGGSDIRIKNNIIKGNITTSSANAIDIRNAAGDALHFPKISNNIIYDFNITGSYGIYASCSDNGADYVYNNTVYNSDTGYTGSSYGLRNYFFNNIAQSCVDGFNVNSSGGDTHVNYNLSNLAGDASGTNSKNSTTVTFRDAANDDYRLAMSDTATKGAGINLSNDLNLPITDDIEGEIRPGLGLDAMNRVSTGVWDIGADQISNTIHNNYSLNLKTDYPQASFSTAENDNDNFSSGDIDLAPNEWSHLVYKRNNNIEELYINGSKKDSGLISDFLKTNNGKLYLGAKNANSENSFKGFLDEVRIYPYARTEDEVKKDTTQGSSGRAASRAAEGVGVSIGDKASDLSDGLVGYWKMDETTWNGTANEVRDASGNGNHGRAGGGLVPSVGKFGNGGVYNQTDGQSVRVSPNSAIDLNTNNQISVSAWVKVASLSGDWAIVYAKNSSNTSLGEFQYMMGLDSSNRLSFIIGQSALIYNNAYGSVPELDRWYFLTGTVKDNQVNLYVDGVLVKAVPLTVAPEIMSVAYHEGLHIGAESSSKNWHGSIDETRIYNRALSPDEVQQLYNYAPGPVLHLKMDEKSGTTAFDSSGYNNHGTLLNSPLWTNGKLNGSLDFDTDGQYLNLGSGEGIDDLGPMTFNTWIYPRSAGQGGDFGTIAGKDAYITAGNWWLYTGDYNNHITFDKEYSSGDLEKRFTSCYVRNQWNFITLTWDGTPSPSGVHMYNNGQECSSDSESSGSGDYISDASMNMYVGGNTAGYSFDGSIDDIKIYNYIRTQEQILEDMSAQAGSIIGSEGNTLKKPILDLNFNEGYGSTAYDQSGNGNNGTLNAGATGTNTTPTMMWDKNGKEGGAMEFDGVNDKVTLPNSLDKNTGTISHWLKPVNNNSMVAYYESNGMTSTIYNGFGSSNDILEINSGVDSIGNYSFFFQDGIASASFKLDGGAVVSNEWVSVVATWDTSGYARLYIDSKLVDSLDISSMNFSGHITTVNNLGEVGDASERYFNGLIDELKIYNYALSEDEIKTLYNDSAAMAIGNDESRNNNGTPITGANKDYCIPGDTAKCDKPVLELKMDEMTGTTAYDTSGNGNNGAFYNGPIWEPNGKIGSAIKFDGGDDYASIANFSLINTSSASISFWFKNNEWSIGNKMLLEYSMNAGANNAFYINMNEYGDGKIAFCDHTSDWNCVYSTDSYTDNSWHHLQFVTDRSLGINQTKIYVDGLENTFQAESNDNSGNFGGPYGLYLFSRGGGSEFVNGFIDDVKIYNYARTPAQIAWDYNQGKPINHWTFDEGIGSTVHDEGDNRNDGAITGATWRKESECKTGKCLYFNGQNTTRILADSQDNMNNFTACAWVNPSAINNLDNDPWMQIINKGWEFKVLNNGKLNLYVGTSSSYPNFITESAIKINEWQRVCAVFKGVGQSSQIFINGNEQALSTSYSGDGTQLDDSASYLSLSADRNNDYFGNFYGYIDDPKVYNYALTDEQIKLEYNNSSAVSFE